MREYKYLIIGGGMTADAAVGGIRECDSQGSIGLISADTDAPYDRPPLTKGLWKDKPLESVWRHTEKHHVDLHLGRTATELDVHSRIVRDDRNEVYRFDRLLLATGGTPRQLPFGGDDIIYFRSLADYRRLRALTEKGQRFAVIGGGFIGSEMAASLKMNGKEVTMIFHGGGICYGMFPPDLSHFLNRFYREKGVEVWNDDSVRGLERRGEQLVLSTGNNRQVVVDGVVAGVGIKPNLSLAQQAGLKTADGVLVDEFLSTSHANIYAAGDVAAFYNPALDRRLRVEHEDNANTMGRQAGRNMAGAGEAYDHLPFFYSDLFELGYEAVGEVNAHLAVLEDWKQLHREGVVYYQQEGQVRGVLLWNVWGQVDAARDLIAARRMFQPEDLLQKLPKAA